MACPSTPAPSPTKSSCRREFDLRLRRSSPSERKREGARLQSCHKKRREAPSLLPQAVTKSCCAREFDRDGRDRMIGITGAITASLKPSRITVPRERDYGKSPGLQAGGNRSIGFWPLGPGVYRSQMSRTWQSPPESVLKGHDFIACGKTRSCIRARVRSCQNRQEKTGLQPLGDVFLETARLNNLQKNSPVLKVHDFSRTINNGAKRLPCCRRSGSPARSMLARWGGRPFLGPTDEPAVDALGLAARERTHLRHGKVKGHDFSRAINNGAQRLPCCRRPFLGPPGAPEVGALGQQFRRRSLCERHP